MDTLERIVAKRGNDSAANRVAQLMKRWRVANLLGARARLIRAAVLRTIRNEKLYKTDGCKTMEAFVEKYELPRATCYRLMGLADKIAELAGLGLLQEITDQHIIFYMESIKRKELPEIEDGLRLLGDGRNEPPADEEETADAGQVDLEKPIIPTHFTETDNDFKQMYEDQRHVDIRTAKEAKRKNRTYDEQQQDIAIQHLVEARIQFLHAHLNGGFSGARRKKAEYYLRYFDYCFFAKPTTGVSIDLTYEDAMELVKQGDPGRIPDGIKYALGMVKRPGNDE